MSAVSSAVKVVIDSGDELSVADEPPVPAASNKSGSSTNGCVKFSSPEASPSPIHLQSSKLSAHHANANHRRTQSETSAASNDASILSSSRTSSSIECQVEPAPDGGWGWVVVFAAFMTNMIADGITYSFGVMYVDFLDYFGESMGKTALIGSLFMGIPLLSGPIASALTDRYGCRKTTIAGALLAALGFFISSFSNSIEVLYFTFGIMSGFGLALCFVAAIVIVSFYFDKRRSFATGLAVCGSGIGTFVFAPFTRYLLDKYHWRGTTIILSGMFLNIVVCGALMRDLEWTKKKYRSEKSLKTSSESISQRSQTSPEEMKNLLLSGMNVSLNEMSPDNLQDCERLCNSLVQLPTFMKGSEPIPPEILEMISSNRINYEFLTEHYPNLLNHSNSGQLDRPSTNDKNNTLETISEGKQDAMVEETIDRTELMPPAKKDRAAWMKQRPLPARRTPTAYFQNLRFHRHSITYRGAMLNIHRYHLRASSCPDIYRNSMITIHQDNDDVMCGFMDELKEILLDMIDFSYFKNIKFLLFCISNILLYIWYDVPYIYITDNAIKMGIHEDTAAYLISIIGILNTVGEILLGYIGDKTWVNTMLLYAAFTAVCGGATALVPILHDYTSLCIIAGIFGFAISANCSLTSIIVVDLITLEKFTNAYGLLLLVQGVANLIGPPLAGWLYDVTNSYDLSFYMAGFWIFISGIMMAVLPFIKLCRRLKGQTDHSYSKRTESNEFEDDVPERKTTCCRKETCL